MPMWVGVRYRSGEKSKWKFWRPDVLSVANLGIVKAFQRAYNLRKAPSPDRLTRIGEAWRS
jgi:3-methyladenine DNA glycosylase/8-oxoguanine DNA glycosylase